MTDTAKEQQGSGGWRLWFVGLLLIAALVGAVLHFGELQNFAHLLQEAQPIWLAIALILQGTTYASVALGWRAVLARAGEPRPLPPLLRIAIGKLFADQALPSAGMGGNVLLIDQLTELSVPRGTAVAALLVSMLGFYSAYIVFALIALLLLWLHGKATSLMAGLVTAFLFVAIGIPSLALWLRHRGSRPLPPRLENLRFIRQLLDVIGQAPAKLLGDRHLLVIVTGFNAWIFLADAATLDACLRAFGGHAPFSTSLIALIMASIVVTLGPIPLGLGSFELVCTGTLKLLGVSVEPALAATLLLRVLTLWLPLIPGMLLMRRMMLHKGGRSLGEG